MISCKITKSQSQLKDQIKKTSSDAKTHAQEEEDEWTQELSRLQLLMPLEISRNRIQSMDLPLLERQIKNQEALIPAMREKAEEVCRVGTVFNLFAHPLRTMTGSPHSEKN
jgi:hypothetical protein